VCRARGVAMVPAGTQACSAGSKSSAEGPAACAPVMGPPNTGSGTVVPWSGTSPPATRTRPSASGVAVWPKRGIARGAVGIQAPVDGSKVSAEARNPSPSKPPAARTRPSCSRVAVCPRRGDPMGPVALQVPRTGS